MNSYELAALWLAWVVAAGSPGPATLSIAGTSMNTGRRAGVIFAIGILVGSAFWGIAAALGMGALMLANAWAFTILRYVGAAYLMYLALKSVRSAFAPDKSLLHKAHSGSALQIFIKGALIHLTNPKAILGWGAIYAIAVPADASFAALYQMFAFLYAGSILVFVGYAFLFSTDGVVRIYHGMRRWFELTFAALFGTASLRVLTTRLE